MKPKYIIGGIIIIVFIAWGASAFFKTTVKYVSFDEARNATRTVQVAGKIDFDDVTFDADNNQLVFSIYDVTADSPVGADRLKIIYKGVVPGNFDQATSVLVRGKPGEGGFVAEKLLVKCPSKYQGMVEESQG
ncbi:MAG: cytochrome c maturation protein CcmE [Candidatus Zixiibacteriota bacterium]